MWTNSLQFLCLCVMLETVKLVFPAYLKIAGITQLNIYIYILMWSYLFYFYQIYLCHDRLINLKDVEIT